VIQAKLLFILGGILLLGAIVYSVYDKGGDDREIKVRAEIQLERETEKKRTDKLSEVKDREWQTKLDDLQSRINGLLVAPGPAIRLCKPAPKVRLPDAPSVVNESPAETGSDLQAGPDIRGQLILYAGDAERCRSQLTELQGWIRGVSAAP